jgi:hypothetical protein
MKRNKPKLIKSRIPKECPYCLTYRSLFIVCESCDTILCKDCHIEISERLICPDCFPMHYENLEKKITEDKDAVRA